MATIIDDLITRFSVIGQDIHKRAMESSARATQQLATAEERRKRSGMDQVSLSQSLSRDLGSLALQYLSVQVAIQGVSRAINEFAASEATAFRASVVLRNLGSSLTIDRLKELGDQMQRLTGVDNDLVVSLGAVLTRFNLTGQQVEDLIPTVLDASAATGRSAEEIASAVGRASLGSSRALRELGIAFKSTGDQGKDLALIAIELEKRFKGAAEAFRDTGGGALQDLKTSIGNLFEALGGESGFGPLANLLSALTRGATSLIEDSPGRRLVRALGLKPIRFDARGRAYQEGDPALDPASRVGTGARGTEAATEETARETAENTKKTADSIGSLGRFLIGGGAAAQGALNVRGLNAALRAGR